MCAAALAVMGNAALAQTVPGITAPPRVQLAPGESASVALPGVVAHSRHVARLENGRLSGEGAAFLSALGTQSQFVLIGEEHGNAAVADFIGAYWRDLSGAGYRYAAVEADPWTTAAMERELRAGGVAQWTQFVGARGGAVAAPFFTWAPEARLVETVISTSRAGREPTLWGLDQVFLGSVEWQLREIATRARSERARTLAAALADASAAAHDLNWFGQSDAAPFIALRAELNGRADRALGRQVDAMIVSQRIYRPFADGNGETWLANLERENQMRRLFLEHYRAAERADGAAPRVMLKFGANHMFRGASTTHVQALGTFVTELGQMTGRGSVAIYVACGPGGAIGTFGPQSISCNDDFAEGWSFLADQVDPNALTVFDLRVWKMRARAWAHLPAETRHLIDSYDVLVIAPNGAASDFLPGIAPPPS
jgi:hypothetical protein